MNIGTFDDTVLVFGGPYSNLEATQALLDRAASLGIPAERMICTGDVVAYCADPQATARLLADSGISVVMGNCEESLSSDADDCGCGFAEGSICDALSVQWYAYAKATLDANSKRWMSTLPPHVELEMSGRTLTVVHGAPSNVSRYIFESTPEAVLVDEIQRSKSDGVICGHSGLPFTRMIDGKLWHNAGVIGLPANDGTPRVWFSTLKPTADGQIMIERHQLTYDHAAAAWKMRERQLPGAYALTLETGLWDNCEILPPAETDMQGRPLAEERIFWSHETTHLPVAAQ